MINSVVRENPLSLLSPHFPPIGLHCFQVLLFVNVVIIIINIIIAAFSCQIFILYFASSPGLFWRHLISEGRKRILQ